MTMEFARFKVKPIEYAMVCDQRTIIINVRYLGLLLQITLRNRLTRLLGDVQIPVPKS